MRCVLVASTAAELLFYWADGAFLRRLRSPHAGQGPALEDSLNTLFAPLIISCAALLEKLADTYTCFATEGGRHLHVLQTFGDCLYIAVNGDGTQTEDDLRRTLFVLRRLVEAHCGLVTLDSHLIRKELRPADSEQRERVWSLLRGLLETYSRLREEDQSFAVEAVERLIHPQLCEQCIEFLERQVVQYINASPERGGDEVGHAFLLVHTKLLAFYSSRNASSIRPADLLVLILLVQDLYPSQSAEEELSSQPMAGNVLPEGPKRSESIPVSGPGSHGAAEKDSDDQWQDTDDQSVPEVYYTPEPSPGGHSTGSESWSEGAEMLSIGEAEAADVQMAEDLLQTLGPLVPEASNPRRIFLDASLREGPHDPGGCHLIPVAGWVLGAGEEAGRGARGGSCTLLPVPGRAAAAHGQVCEEAEWTGHPVAEHLVGLQEQDIFPERAWELLGAAAGSGQREAAALLCVPPALPDLCWPQPVPGAAGPCSEADEGEAAGLAGLPSGEEQAQYHHGVLEDFPGLVHFIYVDRTAGQMMAPSLSVTEKSSSELGKGPLANFIKRKVWSLITLARRYLQKGYTTLMLQDGDYCCSYFLWFENELGYKLEVIEVPVLSDDSAPIGMLAGDYYRKLLRYYSKNHQAEVVKCYELLTVHLGIIPSELVVQQACDLARRLWEPSRIPLL
ncbi:Hermansky-Pudlak syndrome 1 protein isoform X2 [Corapipo altera]|uniref:Hermansky-Pudlak syndrome 1 protein isoform X2 n=1 Tax=Corapipo altera TaxID=415028 RepID=UPI000FD675BE|nr:Hermansky-Pudlak syndrome 1 protein isoform X2 [Corapipo altera]